MRLASYIEHTYLAADATPERVQRVCREAEEHGFFGVCVSPVYVALAEHRVRDTLIRVVSVAGFPFGAATPEIKAEEARRAFGDGAAEIDVVMAIGHALAGDWHAVGAELGSVRRAVPNATLKVILETGYFTPEQIEQAANVAVSEGADFVKTCTGYGPRGATVGDVELLRRVVGERVGVKASGGIRTAAAAREMIEAGATRLGTSGSVGIVAEGD